MDPISLLLMAQSAVSAVRKGCELLQQGKAEIGKIKKAVDDAQAIVKEVKGIWSTILGWFGKSKPTPTAVSPVKAPEPATIKSIPKKKEQEPELTYEEYQTRAIHEVCEQLKLFFEIRRKLKEHCNELEEISKTTTTVEDSALDRVEIEMQLENMTIQIREAMVYAPKELRDIYSRFLKMYDQILEEQEFARQLKKRQEREARWRRELLRNHRIERSMVLVAVMFVVAWIWWVLMLFSNLLGKMRDGSGPSSSWFA